MTHARYEVATLLVRSADLMGGDESANETVADLVGRVLQLPDGITLEHIVALLIAIRDAGAGVPR
jgi:hypothetical protein